MLNIGVDTTEFNRALAEKMKSAKRGAVAELNQQCYLVAHKAALYTPSTSRFEIERYFEIEGYKLRRDKTGAFKRKKTSAAMPSSRGLRVAFAVLNWRRKKYGGQPYERGKNGQEGPIVKAARRLIGARLKSVGFLRLGWVSAMRDLQGSVSFRKSIAGINTVDSGRLGHAIPATEARPVAFAANTVHIKRAPNLDLKTKGLPALHRALIEQAKEMMEHLRKKI